MEFEGSQLTNVFLSRVNLNCQPRWSCYISVWILREICKFFVYRASRTVVERKRRSEEKLSQKEFKNGTLSIQGHSRQCKTSKGISNLFFWERSFGADESLMNFWNSGTFVTNMEFHRRDISRHLRKEYSTN